MIEHDVAAIVGRPQALDVIEAEAVPAPAALSAMLLEILVIRRLAAAPRLVLLMATIGIASVASRAARTEFCFAFCI